MRTCHSVQSGACTKQPPCARCVWLSARAACARHITPCVRARCAFGSPPAHHHSAPSTQASTASRRAGHAIRPRRAPTRASGAERTATAHARRLTFRPGPADVAPGLAAAAAAAAGARALAPKKSSKITIFFQTNPTHTHQHHPTPPKNHHHPPKSPKNHPKFPPPFFSSPIFSSPHYCLLQPPAGRPTYSKKLTSLTIGAWGSWLSFPPGATHTDTTQTGTRFSESFATTTRREVRVYAPPTHNREPYDTLLYCTGSTSCPYRSVCGTDAACSSNTIGGSDKPSVLRPVRSPV